MSEKTKPVAATTGGNGMLTAGSVQQPQTTTETRKRQAATWGKNYYPASLNWYAHHNLGRRKEHELAPRLAQDVNL